MKKEMRKIKASVWETDVTHNNSKRCSVVRVSCPAKLEYIPFYFHFKEEFTINFSFEI